MFLKHLSIQNFKGLVHCEVDLEPGFNLLIGDNGKGKTSILEAASVALGGFIAGIDHIPSKHIVESEIRVSSSSMGDGSFNQQFETPVSIYCCADVNGDEVKWTRQKNSVSASRTTVEPRDICKIANAMSKNPQSVLPVLSYQSAARAWMQKRDSSNKLFDTQFSRTLGYRNCLEEATDSKSLLNWCAKMEQVSWQKNKPIGEYESVKNAVSTFMSVMSGTDVCEIQFDKQSSELSYKEGDGSLPLRYLSAGYQSVIWMVLDIAYRMAVLNPNLREKATEGSGVVLIDELDVHLHPKWQWNIISALTQTFPNVQFISATHSPIIIASCKRGKLIDVNGDNISYPPSGYGVEINDVLTSTQESKAMDERVHQDLSEVYQRIEGEDFNGAQEKIEALEVALGENHPEIIKVKTQLQWMKSLSEV